ncbi:MAG: hypothetical protein FWD40_06215 [Treponema sp.]|nr:hypothetical protein [Treponema sp.]
MNDDENASGKRPNAKYALSYDNDTPSADEGLTFHYNRGRRLSNAPVEVQNLYKEQKQSRFGIFGALVADKPRRFLLIVIVLLCLAVLALSRFGYFDTIHEFDGNKIDVSATKYEGTTIIILRKSIRNANAYTGAVDIAVSVPAEPADGDYPVFSHRIFFTMENEEVYRFAAPFDEIQLLMVLQNENSSLQMKFNPD